MGILADDEHLDFASIDHRKRQFRQMRTSEATCSHAASKVADGNVLRCGKCKRIVGFLRAPTRKPATVA